jgi:general secretion pathway protein G
LRRLKGFSIYEILTVIAVLMVLVLFSYLSATSQMRKARDAQRKSDLSRMRIALEEYYFTFSDYPRDLPDCGLPLLVNNSKILEKVPCDPKTGERLLL